MQRKHIYQYTSISNERVINDINGLKLECQELLESFYLKPEYSRGELVKLHNSFSDLLKFLDKHQ